MNTQPKQETQRTHGTHKYWKGNAKSDKRLTESRWDTDHESHHLCPVFHPLSLNCLFHIQVLEAHVYRMSTDLQTFQTIGTVAD